ncbi:hypothetical protein CDD82_6297 [Ophiocordyceps australis]|uniref:Uncharacterized protein n=1 Tax=Ophiocordyceps australis TaxID=1399860 RepID=A0A2C5Y180_9HYPO|nr:hypothetical protein CDD82_6297 [Ophiocordyceps australis]
MLPRRAEHDLAAAAPRLPTRQSATSQPATNQPATSQPATSQPATSQPATSQLATILPASPRTLKHESRRIGAGPDLPPTPPTYSRNSSGSHAASTTSMTPACASAALLSSPSILPCVSDGLQRILTTPPHQQSPLTPDVTPPSPVRLSRIPRLSASEHRGSRLTPTDWRLESFQTARQDAPLSGNETAASTVRPRLDSTTLSQFTNRSTTDSKTSRLVHARALSLALKQLDLAATDSQSNHRSVKFDGDWGSPSDIEREWDDNLGRFVSVRMRRTCPALDTAGPPIHHQIPQRTRLFHLPDNATMAAKTMDAKQMPISSCGAISATTPESTMRRQASSKCSTADTAVAVNGSSASSPCPKPTPSAVVQAMVVEPPPQKRPYLRHVSKKSILRDSSLEKQPLAQNDARPKKHVSAIPVANKTRRTHHETRQAGSTKKIPVSSAQARNQVWSNGDVPVAVVPCRLSSSQAPPVKEPSLRSTSARPCKRSNSVSSPPTDSNPGKPPALQSASKRGPMRTHRRSASESSPWNLSSMDYPPPIPPRISSLSATTSCNPSRAVSLNATSLKALEKLQSSPPRTPTKAETTGIEPLAPKPRPQALKQAEVQTPTSDVFQNATTAATSPTVSRNEDALSFKRHTRRNTPFSVTSLETILTAQEVSEALAIHMVSHRNSSILMVNNTTRPLDALQILSQSQQSTNVPEKEHLMVWPQERQSKRPAESRQRQPTDSRESRQLTNSLEAEDSINFLQARQPNNSQEARRSRDLPETSRQSADFPAARQPQNSSEFGQSRNSLQTSQPNNLKTSANRQSRHWLDTIRPNNVAETGLSRNLANPTTRKPVPTKPTVQSPAKSGLANDSHISPLSRNPPALPQIAEQPPAINLIPATPSGATPAEEKVAHLGNYHEPPGGKKSSRRPSLVRRAFSRRNQPADYAPLDTRRRSLLDSSLSFSRPRPAKPAGGTNGSFPLPLAHNSPAEQERLHPFWRPWYTEMQDECTECALHHHDYLYDDVFRYPLVDHGGRISKPSFKAKLRRTFAVLPDRNQPMYYGASNTHGLERRTIRRTPSGHLRVMHRRTSSDSLRPPAYMPSWYMPTASSAWRRLWRKRNLRCFSLGCRLDGASGISRIINQHRFRPDLMPGKRDANTSPLDAIEPATIRYARRDAPMLP